MNGKLTYYWDTCIFYAWLKDEKLEPGEMEGINYIIEENKNDKNLIITSAITICEILQGKIPFEKEEQFQKSLMRRNIIVVGVDIRICEEARRIRDYYYQNNPHSKTVGTPDAIHLATAIHHNVTEFDTFDARHNRGSLGLLSLNGNVAGHNLLIRKPNIGNILPLFKP